MDVISIIWNVDPEFFSLGPFTVRWYGLLFASAFFFGYLILSRYFKNENLKPELLDKLTLYMALAVIIGARLGHCLFYEPAYYLANPVEILMIWKGGLSGHGAVVTILIALYIFSKQINKPYLWVIDRIVIIVALGGFFIRMGNLMNSEIYGIETTLPWGFIFVNRGEIMPKHPTQIYEALSYLAIFFLLNSMYWKKYIREKQGYIFGIFLILLFSARFLIEFIKEPQVGFEENMLLNMGQLLSFPLIIAGIIIFLRAIKKVKTT